MSVPRLDVFPALVDTPDGPLRTARAVIDGKRLLVFQDSQRAGVQIVASAELAEVPDVRGNRWSLTDTSGGTWTIMRSGGCGCGNRLKRVTAGQLLELAGVAP